MSNYSKSDDAIAGLSPEQFRVTQQSGTERPFTGEYDQNDAQGLYVDIVSGEPLFTSNSKFDAGCGWPSFTKPVEETHVVELTDNSLGRARVEVRSSHGDSHLGHVFTDGPADQGGLRYCINSASLRFVPLADLEGEGYGDYLETIKAGK